MRSSNVEFEGEDEKMIPPNLDAVLERLVKDGDITFAIAQKIKDEYSTINVIQEGKRRILPEVAGYLGALFIVIALALIIGNQWNHIAKWGKVSLVGLSAVLLFSVSLYVGTDNLVRRRLASVLALASAAATSMTIAILGSRPDSHSFFPILAGWIVAVAGWILYRSIIGELGLAGFSVLLSVALSSEYFQHVKLHQLIAPLMLLFMSGVWLWFSYRQTFHRALGNGLGMAMFFLSGQLVFVNSYRLVAYLIAIGMAIVASWIFAKTPDAPLLIGGIVAITVGTGELVGDTLGGALGAAIGLLVAGIIFVTSGVYWLNKSRKSRTHI